MRLPSFEARPEAEILGDLRKLTTSGGYVHALAYFSSRDNFVFYGDEVTPEDMARSYVPTRLLRTELNTLIGLTIQAPIDSALPHPTTMQQYIDQTTELMDELQASLNKPMMELFKPENITKAERPFSQAEILREPIFYGGESAFNFQFSALAVQRYADDDKWLGKHVGFRSADMLEFERALAELQHEKMSDQVARLRSSAPEEWSFLNVFTFKLSELTARGTLSTETLRALLDAFSVTPGDANPSFVDIGDFNAVTARPIIALEDDVFLSLQSYSLCEALYDSPFYWMQDDKDYRSSAQAHRGKFTEAFVAERFAAVFGRENVFTNVNLERGRSNRAGEIDVFVRFGDRALVVQCKSKKLTLEARKGNDGQLKSDFRKAVQDTYDQALKCSEHLKAGDVRLVLSDGSELDAGEFTELYPVAVTSENYPALTVQAREILSYLKDDDVIQPPFVADVFLIDVLCEFLISPLYLLSFLNRRVNYHEKLNVVSEFTILAFHLKSNLWIDDDTHFLMLDDTLAIDLDTAFTVRRQGYPGSNTPEGILTRLRETYVGRLLRAIERSPEPPLIDLGFSLLKLSEDTIGTLEQGVAQICRQTQNDGKLHDLTLAFGEADEGLTIHCNPKSGPIAVEKLHDHCERRKYVSKARKWFGLSVRATDGMPKFGVNLKGEWKQDVRLAEATKHMNLKGNLDLTGRTLKRVKIGRNEQCPCGSGLKFKKCCLPRGR